MSKRRYLKTHDFNSFNEAWDDLPVHAPVAVYYRQSTVLQVGNVSTDVQLTDLPFYLRRLGWSDDLIIVLDEDAGVSGAKKIDQRVGMSRLFDLIQSQKIRAVACIDEDRLFRDISQIQVNIFIQACYEANVRIITANTIYNFNHPIHGLSHIRQFRFRSEMAAEFLTQVVHGRLWAAKHRMAMEGRWTGGNYPVGFIIDRRKFINGQKNPHWNKFVPFEPYSNVVLRYFEMFLENKGVLKRTAIQIAHFGPYYPATATVERFVPQGHLFKLPSSFKLLEDGTSYPTWFGLRCLLVNAAYAGHWTYHGQLIHWNNHPPIVPEQLFLKAFNYLSDKTLGGEPNDQYVPSRIVQRASPETFARRGVERPLFEDMVFCEHKGEMCPVTVHWSPQAREYTYVFAPTYDIRLWHKHAHYLDQLIEKFLQKKLALTFQSENFQQALIELNHTYRLSRRSLQHEIAHLKIEIHSIISNLSHITSPELVQEIQALYVIKNHEQRRLEQQLKKTSSQYLVKQQMLELREQYQSYSDTQVASTLGQRQLTVQKFVERIIVQKTGGEQQILIYWRDKSVDELTSPNETSRFVNWTKSQIEQLLWLAMNGAPQVVIAAAFPSRAWRHIACKLNKTLGKPHVFTTSNPLKIHESHSAYLQRINSGSHQDKRLSWTTEEETLLRRLVTDSATRETLQLAFPERGWTAIVARARKKSKLWTDGVSVSIDYEAVITRLNTIKPTAFVEDPKQPINLTNLIFALEEKAITPKSM